MCIHLHLSAQLSIYNVAFIYPYTNAYLQTHPCIIHLPVLSLTHPPTHSSTRHPSVHSPTHPSSHNSSIHLINFHLSTYPFIHPPTHYQFFTSSRPAIYLPTDQFTHHPSIQTSLCSYLYRPTHALIHPSIHSAIHPPKIHPSSHLSTVHPAVIH